MMIYKKFLHSLIRHSKWNKYNKYYVYLPYIIFISNQNLITNLFLEIFHFHILLRELSIISFGNTFIIKLLYNVYWFSQSIQLRTCTWYWNSYIFSKASHNFETFLNSNLLSEFDNFRRISSLLSSCLMGISCK